MRAINVDTLMLDIYDFAFENDSEDQMWNSGCWIRYRAIERIVDAQPKIEMESLTDSEKRIFLAAMARELKVCEKMEKASSGVPLSLVHICNEIIRKVKDTLWN